MPAPRQPRAQLLDRPLDVRLAALAPGVEQPGELAERLGLQRLEAEVLELPLDLPDPEPLRQRGVDLHRLAGDPLLLLGLEGAQRAHVVEPVGELDEDDPDVLGHRQEHLPDVLGLLLLVAVGAELRELRDAVDEVGDLGAEPLLDVGEAVLGVLGDVVEERGRDRDRVDAELREDLGRGDRVGDVRLARGADLRAGAPRRRGRTRARPTSRSACGWCALERGEELAFRPPRERRRRSHGRRASRRCRRRRPPDARPRRAGAGAAARHERHLGIADDGLGHGIESTACRRAAPSRRAGQPSRPIASSPDSAGRRPSVTRTVGELGSAGPRRPRAARPASRPSGPSSTRSTRLPPRVDLEAAADLDARGRLDRRAGPGRARRHVPGPDARSAPRRRRRRAPRRGAVGITVVAVMSSPPPDDGDLVEGQRLASAEARRP